MAKANPVVSGTNVTQMARAVVSITKDEVFNWINGLDNVELSTVQEFVNVEANGRRESRLSALREEAERLGVKLAERKARNPNATLGTMPAKYQDDKGNTWSGRGLRAKWLSNAIAAGAKIEDFLVKPAPVTEAE